jgi:hypothetical protein
VQGRGGGRRDTCTSGMRRPSATGMHVSHTADREGGQGRVKCEPMGDLMTGDTPGSMRKNGLYTLKKCYD